MPTKRCEAARDGLSYAEAVTRGYTVLGPDDVLDDVARLLPRIESRRCSATGRDSSCSRTLCGAQGRDRPADPETPWGAGAVTIEVVNEGDVPIGLTHFHVFEANGALRFDRASAWGMRLDVPAGVKVFFEPGVR